MKTARLKQNLYSSCQFIPLTSPTREGNYGKHTYEILIIEFPISSEFHVRCIEPHFDILRISLN